MKVELWFRGRPIVKPDTAITLPEDRLTERERQTINLLDEVTQSRMRSLPECFCQKRYGHTEHSKECPHWIEK